MIKIGTRSSKLAVYQATLVQNKLQKLGIASELVFINTIGDTDQETPLGAFKNPGIFANELNQQVLDGNVDLAVHSCKDMPSTLEQGLELTAVLERANETDTLVYKQSFTEKIKNGDPVIIATSSERRKFQWLKQYPNSIMVELRGNIPTRLDKLYANNWDGAIFAQAALSRLAIEPEYTLPLIDFIPASTQGTIAIVSRQNDKQLHQILNQINHPATYVRTSIEREILRNLKVGCSTPFGVIARFQNNCSISIKAQLFNYDGSKVIQHEVKGFPLDRDELINSLVNKLRLSGASEIIEEFKLTPAI